MSISRIYTDYSSEIRWIRGTVLKEVRELPAPVQEIAEYYLKRRLTIVFDAKYPTISDPLFGSPDPYAVFWFADAFGLNDEETVRRVALGMIYATLSITLKDDLLDRADWPTDRYIWLSDIYSKKYSDGFGRMFPRSSSFWYHFSVALAETARYEAWRIGLRQTGGVNAFSAHFLEESSRYFVSVVAPSLVAIAMKSGRTRAIPRIMRFLRDFAMAWRVFDDLCDWEEDLKAPTFNGSSVLYSLLGSGRERSTLSKSEVLRAFASGRFVETAYGTMLEFLDKAKGDVRPLKSSELNMFLEEQIRFNEERKERLLGSVQSFENGLVQLLGT